MGKKKNSGAKEHVQACFTFLIVLAIAMLPTIMTGCSTKPQDKSHDEPLDLSLTLNNNTDSKSLGINFIATDASYRPNASWINESDIIQEGNDLKILGLDIQLLNHDSVKIKDKKIIYIDPFQLSEGPGLEKADLILITHSHYDHCSPKDVEKIATEKTVIITVADCQSKLSGLKVKGIALIEPGKSITFGNDTITAVRAYNINKSFHPKANDWVGFIVEMDGVRVYHAGDTDLIPEMKDIDTDIAFLPVSGTYVMTAKEAAQATKILKRCRIAIPMHYGSVIGNATDAEIFKENAGCEVKILI